jgi:hypothetical protein
MFGLVLLVIIWYRDLLLNNLPDLLQDVPLRSENECGSRNDGAAAHFSFILRDVLNNTYRNERTRRGRPTAWPPRSPHFSPPGFYLLRHLKVLAYSTPTHNVETLQWRIANTCLSAAIT